MINKNLKAKELYIVGTKEDSFNECQDASSRASGSKAKRACQGCFVTLPRYIEEIIRLDHGNEYRKGRKF